MSSLKIPTFVINLKKRTDRKERIQKEFSGRSEFQINIVSAQEHPVGAIGLWNTIKYIVNDLTDKDDDFILLCEDDHCFTEHYSKEILFNNIRAAKKKSADILSGGVSWFNGAVQLEENLFWVQKFSATQFIVVFRKFFKVILETPFSEGDDADYKISNLSENKFFIYPFISTQKEYGYSDISAKNNQEGYLTDLFAKGSKCLENLRNVSLFYRRMKETIRPENELDSFENISIPTYVISQSGDAEKKKHITFQFAGKTEFDITLIEPLKNKSGIVSIWQSIRKIIGLAVENDDDVIVICHDDHEFTEYYSKEYFFKNIYESYLQGVNVLSGGTSHFLQTFPVTENRFWIDIIYGSQFVVIYRNLFQKILEESFDENDLADSLLSLLTSNKMVFFPFISVQKEFDCIDLLQKEDDRKGLIAGLFTSASERLEIIQRIYRRYLKLPVEKREEGSSLIELIKKVNNSDFENVFTRNGFKKINLLSVYFRSGTCDETVIKETFQDEIFGRGFPEYHIKSNHIVIDIGAHIGAYSLKLSQELTDGIVYAFEPCLETYSYLEKNIKTNNIENIVPKRIALSNDVGHTKLYYDYKNGNWGHSIVKNFSDVGEWVATDTLSNFFVTNDIKKCDLIKLNCEGAEFKILLSTPVSVLQMVTHMLILYHLDIAQEYTTRQLQNHLERAGFYTEIRNETPDKKRGWLIAIQSSLQN